MTHMCTCCLQVEQLYNGLLDRADQLREEMGDITDNVSLRTALESIWNDMAGDARAQLAFEIFSAVLCRQLQT